jgi:hypothetical protein
MEGTLQGQFYEFSATLIWKPDKDATTKDKPLSLIDRDAKILNKILGNQIKQCI